ncbi:MAG TPA: DAK2 domain-containing protein, partial [Streptosporangiaceae bacterium]|nr:DAK2 domain-containing protein [Streptosporangiaceae bacterium]
MDAAVFRAWIVTAAEVIEANRDHLTQLDAAIGDADHGINLARGFTAVLGALDAASPGAPGAILTLTGN